MSGTKEIETNTCEECESTYKLVYTQGEASGYPKFCPFCGADINTDEEVEEDYQEIEE